VVVPFAAGVSPDVVSRIVSRAAGRGPWGSRVVIDNRAGAAGIIGAEAGGASSPGDGYTLFMTVNSIMGINPNGVHQAAVRHLNKRLRARDAGGAACPTCW
jgi:tripartite-type tricarboxylate transporter receptor subunit TctC